jgi:ketosteroid isomerase-like protein
MMTRAFLFALLLVVDSPLAWAHQPTDILEIDASWNESRLASDTKALGQLLADDWLLTHSDGRVQNKSEYLQELSSRARSNQRIENQDVQLRKYGDAAVVTGVSVQDGVSNGQPWSGRFRFTRVWVSRNGEWVMVASHSSRVAP